MIESLNPTLYKYHSDTSLVIQKSSKKEKKKENLLRSPVIQVSMAEFTADLQSFRPSFPVLDIDPNMESLSVLTTSDMDFQSFMSFSNDRFFGHQAPEFAGNLVENFPGAAYQFNQNVVPVADQPANVAAGDEFHDSRKRKAMDDNDKPENSSGTSSPPVSESGSRRKNVMICSVSFFLFLFLSFL
jgi:hypothetical protein